MPTKKNLGEKLETYSREFIESKKRKELLASLKGDEIQWLTWASKMKAVLGNLATADKLKFSALLALIEKSPDSVFFQNKMKEFLIDRVQFWIHYQFGKRKRPEEMGPWVDRIFKLLTSKSFIRLLIIILIIAFIIWFYIDRAAYLEFIKSIIKSFFQAIR